MKIKEIKVYEFHELSSESQDQAIEYFANKIDFSSFWSMDYKNTLDKFCDIFDVKLRDWNIDTYSYDYRISSIPDTEISGLKLYKLIQNSFWDSLYSKKIFYKNDKKRKSKILLEQNDITGFCADYAILEPIYDYIKKPNLKYNYKDLIELCLDSFFSYWLNDIEYQYSSENIKEFIEINDYEFLESGELA